MGSFSRDAAVSLARVGAWIVATFAGLLPRRVYLRWQETLPVFHIAIPAAVLTMAIGFLTGFPAFLRFAEDAASRNNAAMLRIADKQSDDPSSVDGPLVTTAAPVAFTAFSAIAFLLFTPTGLLCSYLVVSGGTRTILAILDHPEGDLILAALDRAWQRRSRLSAEHRAEEAFARRAGPRVSDRLLPADWAGLTGFDYVVVASRPKPEWTPGTVLDCGDRWFRVAASFERELAVGLRIVYPLAEVRAGEVFRRRVAYALPPLTTQR